MGKDIPEQVKQAAERFRNQFEGLRREIHKVIVGHNDIVEGVLVCLFAGGHALLEGVPGLGKTLLVRTLAESMQLEFSRIQFTPDLMPADIIGTNIIMEDQATGARSSASSGARCSRRSCWPTRSTAPRPRRSRPCWRPCRRSRSPSRGSGSSSRRRSS